MFNFNIPAFQVFNIAEASNNTNQTAAGTSTCGTGQKPTLKAAAEKSAKTITAFQRFQPYRTKVTELLRNKDSLFLLI